MRASSFEAKVPHLQGRHRWCHKMPRSVKRSRLSCFSRIAPWASASRAAHRGSGGTGPWRHRPGSSPSAASRPDVPGAGGRHERSVPRQTTHGPLERPRRRPRKHLVGAPRGRTPSHRPTAAHRRVKESEEALLPRRGSEALASALPVRVVVALTAAEDPLLILRPHQAAEGPCWPAPRSTLSTKGAA